MMSMIPHLEHGIGAYLPKEGMHQITRALENLMRKMGVEIYLESKVEKILYQGKKVQGVQVNGETLESDIVVSNVDAYFTYHQLLPQFPKPEKILKQERSSSAIIFYWGMRREFPELDVHNLFFADDYEKEFDGIFKRGQLSDDVTVYVNVTSKKVASDAPPSCENWFVMINAPRHQGGDETAMITSAKKAILKKLNSILKMDVERYIEVEDILTPRLIQERTSSYAGSLYGTASNNESNRSKNPPCPGMKLPESFTPASRLILLSSRSPKVPAMALIEETARKCQNNPPAHQTPAKVTSAELRITPPMVPSQVFLGEIGESGVFPIREPTIYAIVSLIHIEAMTTNGAV
jgi:phytoene dehydrogenase-like protein